MIQTFYEKTDLDISPYIDAIDWYIEKYLNQYNGELCFTFIKCTELFNGVCNEDVENKSYIDITIFLTENHDDNLSILFHELTHAKQLLSKKLIINHDTWDFIFKTDESQTLVYRNLDLREVSNTFYLNLPWEIEAWNAEVTVKKEYYGI